MMFMILIIGVASVIIISWMPKKRPISANEMMAYEQERGRQMAIREFRR